MSGPSEKAAEAKKRALALAKWIKERDENPSPITHDTWLTIVEEAKCVMRLCGEKT